MSIFRKKVLRKNRFSKAVHFVIGLSMVIQPIAGIAIMPAKALAVAPSVSLFSDEFELGDFSQWTSSGLNWGTVNNPSGAHSGSKLAGIRGNANNNPPLIDSSLLKEISTVGYQDISLSYWYKVSGLELLDLDHVLAQWSLDGVNWTTLEDFMHGNDNISSWTQKTYSLPSSADNQSSLKFRFSATLNAFVDTFRLDDVAVSGALIPYNLSVSKSGHGMGVVSSDVSGINCGSDCSADFDYPTPVILTAVPDAGSSFTGWSGDCSGTQTTCNIVMDGNKTAIASFIDPILSLQKTADKSAVSAGNSLRYSIRAKNSALDAATPVALTDTVPAGLTITGATCAVNNGATCSVDSAVNPVTVSGSLPADSFFDVFVDTVVDVAAPDGIISNYADLTYGATVFRSNSLNITIDKTAPLAPSATPAGGDYSVAQTVTLSSSDVLSGLKEIRYTTDGSVPTVSSALYSAPMLISQNTTLKAIAIDNAGNISETMTAVYGIAAQISAQSISETSSESVIIKWTTDKPATSRVVYDTVPRSILGLAPNYGYAYSTQEQDIFPKVASHNVTLAGLTPGTTYYYRTISKASPEAVSAESSFNTAPNIAPVANAHGPYEAILKDGKAEVSLIGTGTDTDGSIVKYEWDFEGDGIFDLAILPSAAIADGSISHIYGKEGAHKPVLRVTDNRGAVGTDATKAVISAHGTAAAFSAGPGDLTVASDGQLALFSTAVDSFGNSWSAAADTIFTSDDPCGKISGATYYPCKAGEWEIQAEYQALKAKIKVKVATGDLDRLEISPYAKPFKIQENKSQVFTVKGFDADNNEVTVLDPEWETTGEKTAIGKIDENGKFLATHGGIGRITAKVGKLTIAVGVIVKQVKVAAPIKKKTNIAKAAADQAAISDQAEETVGSVPAEEEQFVSSEETKPAEDGTVAGEEKQACTTLPWGVWYGLAAFYAIFLIIYYMNLRKLDKEHGLARNWWAIPLLLTGVMIGIYFLYRCPGVFLRWPWAMILIGVIISAVYYQSREPEDLPPAGSVMSGDDNIKTI